MAVFWSAKLKQQQQQSLPLMIRYTNKFPRFIISNFLFSPSTPRSGDLFCCTSIHPSLLPPSAVQGSPSSSSRGGQRSKMTECTYANILISVNMYQRVSQSQHRLCNLHYTGNIIPTFTHKISPGSAGEREKEMLRHGPLWN